LGSLVKSQNFILDWPERGLISVEEVQTGRKYDFQEIEMVLYSFYVQLLLINLISNINLKV